MSSIKLYQSSASPNSRRVRIFIAEKAMDVTSVAVDLGAKEQFSAGYLAINSRSMVPTLVTEDGTSIGEVPAIWRYLEEVHPAHPLLGSTPTEKALITLWERRAELDGFIAVMEAVRNAVPGLKGRALAGPHAYEQIPELVERSKARVVNFYADMEKRLADVPFLAGQHFSAADITALVSVDFATRALSIAIGADQPSLQKWYDTVSARPSMSA
ncbi:glutathione S-transferase family protein [Pseudomonas sp. NA-150]|uniref:glutathione S-transferase family protein n=1 Tax=Pseudomonas sp. NA-150 TaxID=3367525 RepID=UPI0037C799C6